MATVVDTRDYLALYQESRLAGKKIRSAVSRGMSRAARPVMKEIVEAGAEKMPSAGGLDQHMAAARVGLSQTPFGVKARLGSKGRALGRVDESGIVRHPLHGNRKFWFPPSVGAGAWSPELDERAPEVQRAVESALDDYVKQI